MGADGVTLRQRAIQKYRPMYLEVVGSAKIGNRFQITADISFYLLPKRQLLVKGDTELPYGWRYRNIVKSRMAGRCVDVFLRMKPIGNDLVALKVNFRDFRYFSNTGEIFKNFPLS